MTRFQGEWPRHVIQTNTSCSGQSCSESRGLVKSSRARSGNNRLWWHTALRYPEEPTFKANAELCLWGHHDGLSFVPGPTWWTEGTDFLKSSAMCTSDLYTEANMHPH